MGNSITHEFAQRHPAVVANLLNQGDLAETIEYLQSLPADTLLAVLSRLEDMRLRAVLAGLDDKAIGLLLHQSNHETFIALVAQIPNHRYGAIINAAEDDRVEQRLQGYAAQTLGAIASAEFISVVKKQTVANLRTQLAAAEFAEDDPIIVVGEDKKVIGILSPLVLLADANGQKSVGSLVESVEPLDELTPINQAIKSRLWQRHKVLPVATASKELIGVVRLGHLLKISTGGQDALVERDMVSELLQQYFLVCGELLALLFSRPTK